MSRFFIILFFLAISCRLHSQKATNYNHLLWRISGNGISKPSFLYGTMHLADKRVFQFGDSVYKGLEQVEGFAAELDIAAMSAKIFDQVFEGKEKDGATFLPEVLDEKRLARYKAGIEKKFNKKIDAITVQEVKDKASEVEKKVIGKGEMSTFMDVYLFDIARKQGKWVGGIEDFEDQMNSDPAEELEEDLYTILSEEKQVNKMMEWMIDTYIKEDLESIDLNERIWKGGADMELLTRNIKMARRIDSIIHIRSCFFAVGAAHIPGDTGVVNLLRQRGYTVTPVISSKKVAPEKYTYKAVEIPWVNVKYSEELFNLMMPGEPNDIESDDMPVAAKSFIDLSTMLVYFNMSIPLPEVSGAFKDSIMSRIARSFQKKAQLIDEKNITVNNEKGKEFSLVIDDGSGRLQIFMPGNYIVVNMVFSAKEGDFSRTEADRFFNSFKVLKRKMAVTDVAGEWKTYTFNDHAFSVMMPVNPNPSRNKNKLAPNEGWAINTYQVMANSNKIFYGIVIQDAKEGHYSDGDSVYFAEVLSGLNENGTMEMVSNRRFTFNDFPAFEVKLKQKSEDEGEIFLQTFMVNRGNRRYYIYVSHAADIEKEYVDKFFSSFTLLPISDKDWKQSTAPDKSFSMWSPAAITTDSSNWSKVYDAASANSVYISKEKVSPLYWSVNDSTLLYDKINEYVDYPDSIISLKKIKLGNAPGIDATFYLSDNHLVKKVLLLLHADTLYGIYSYTQPDLLQTTNYQKLFSTFRILNDKAPSASLFQRKPAELLAAFSTTDSTKFAEAKVVYYDVEFKQEDVPLLQKAMISKCYDFDTIYYSGMNNEFERKIIKLDSNNTSVSFVRNNYNTVKDEYMKPYMLSLLSNTYTAESYQLLKELIINRLPAIDKPLYMDNGLYDSLLLTSKLYPEVLSSINNKGFWETLTPVTTFLLDSNYIKKEIFFPYKNKFVQLANNQLAIAERKNSEDNYSHTYLVKLLGVFNTPETNALIVRFSKLKYDDLTLACITALLKNKQPVARTELLTLAKKHTYRIDLYKELKEAGKQNLFPVEYLSQRQFSASEIYTYGDENEYTPDDIIFIKEKIVGNKKYYLYEVKYEDGEESYLGIAGPYPANTKQLQLSGEHTEIYWDEQYDKTNLEELFKKYIESLLED